MKSRFATICRECSTQIPVGADITKRGPYWVHEKCPVIEMNQTHTVETKPEYIELPLKNTPGMCGRCERTFGAGRRSGRYFEESIEVCEHCFDSGIKHRMWGK